MDKNRGVNSIVSTKITTGSLGERSEAQSMIGFVKPFFHDGEVADVTCPVSMGLSRVSGVAE